jgi:hypothetical protein
MPKFRSSHNLGIIFLACLTLLKPPYKQTAVGDMA